MIKSNLIADSFNYENRNTVKIGTKFVVRGRVDGKRVYFVEVRAFGYLEQSTTCTSLKAVRGLV